MNASRITFLATGAAFAAGSQIARAQGLPKVVVGSSTIDAASALISAQHNGYFTKNGLEVEIITGSGAASAAAIAGGTMQFAASNIVTLIKAHLQGIGFLMVAPSSMYVNTNPTQVLCTRTDSGFKTAADLNGKTIAVNGLKTIAQLGPEAWIDQNGGDLASVKFIEMPFPEMENALDAHRIDAALLSEPVLSDARSRGIRVMANVYDALGKEFTIGTWFATSGWAHDHPDLVRKYIAVMKQTARWANANHAESAQILQAETQTPVSSTTTRVVFGETLDERQIQTLIDACARYGVIKTRFPAHDIIAQT
jgi:NitT/TauT family transport system substrate-binding protein